MLQGNWNGKEAAMTDFLQFAEIAGAVLVAIGLALGLEWFTLNRLMHMMPHERSRTRDMRQ